MVATRSQPGRWNRLMAPAIWAGLTVVSIALYRRMSGGEAQRIGVPAAALLTTFAALLGMFAYVQFRRTRLRAAPPSGLILAGLFTLIPPAIIGIVLLPAGSALGTWYPAVLFTITCTVIFALGEMKLRSPSHHGGDDFLKLDELKHSGSVPFRANAARADYTTPDAPPDAMPTSTTAGSEPQAADWSDSASEEAASDVTLRLQRCLTEDGYDCVEGTLKLRFTETQKRAVIHLPFTPAFPRTPELECEVLDDADAQLKVAALHPYGARIEARRSQAGEPETVTVEFVAFAESQRDVA